MLFKKINCGAWGVGGAEVPEPIERTALLSSCFCKEKGVKVSVRIQAHRLRQTKVAMTVEDSLNNKIARTVEKIIPPGYAQKWGPYVRTVRNLGMRRGTWA